VNPTLLLPLLVFAFGPLVVAAVGMRLANRASVVDRRLREVTGQTAGADSDQPQFEAVVRALKSVGSKVPRSPAEMGKLRLRLVQAGFRGEGALPLFFGIRVALAFGLFALCATPVLFKTNIPLAIGALGLGFLAPGIVLARLGKRRQHRLRLSLADAVDLLVVSVEAGLGLDQALLRVG